MSITTIARQARGMRAGEVIAKLAEDAYFMRVDNRVTQAPPLRTREADHESTTCSPANNSHSHTRGELSQTPTALGHLRRTFSGRSQHWSRCGNRAVVAHDNAGGSGSDGGSSSHGAGRRPGGGGDRGGRGHADSQSPMSHAAATMPVVESKKFDARNPP
jgi:hypothetical protein